MSRVFPAASTMGGCTARDRERDQRHVSGNRITDHAKEVAGPGFEIPLPPITNATPSPSGESAESPLVSWTARTWTWGVGDATGSTAMRLVPATATLALR
ncbi:MAG: hypothetical protein WCF69_09870 [Mycobacterium sp.]